MKKGFTLIEVIVVLVIISIVSLITVPIVLNIIDKSSYSINQRNIERYAHAVELAMAEYKLEHGHYTYDINDLSINYSGKRVECDIVNLNENGSVYVNKCKIDGEYVEDENSEDGYYHTGNLIYEYEIGDEIKYNNIDYYVIQNVAKSDKQIKLFKKESINCNEINDVIQTASVYDKLSLNSGSLYMKYLYDDNCSSSNVQSCVVDYSRSSVKEVVDVWANKYIKDEDKAVDDMGYVARLLSSDELFNTFGFEKSVSSGTISYKPIDSHFNRLFNNWSTFTMVPSDDSIISVLQIYSGEAKEIKVYEKGYIRPVVNLKKMAIEE